MATKKPKIVTRRKVESVRERADKVQEKKSRPSRQRKVSDAASRPVKGVRAALAREYHPIKLPDNKTGRVLTKRRSVIPEYVKGSWEEIKNVTWPTRRQAANMTFAVITFSVVIALVVRLLDFGFEKLFREVILK